MRKTDTAIVLYAIFKDKYGILDSVEKEKNESFSYERNNVI